MPEQNECIEEECEEHMIENGFNPTIDEDCKNYWNWLDEYIK